MKHVTQPPLQRTYWPWGHISHIDGLINRATNIQVENHQHVSTFSLVADACFIRVNFENLFFSACKS